MYFYELVHEVDMTKMLLETARSSKGFLPFLTNLFLGHKQAMCFICEENNKFKKRRQQQHAAAKLKPPRLRKRHRQHGGARRAAFARRKYLHRTPSHPLEERNQECMEACCFAGVEGNVSQATNQEHTATCHSEETAEQSTQRATSQEYLQSVHAGH